MDLVLANSAPGILSAIAKNPYAQQAALKGLFKAGSYAAKYYSGGGGRVLKYSPAYKPKSMVRRAPYRKRGRVTRKAAGGAGSYRQYSRAKRRKLYRKKAKARRPKSNRKLTKTVTRLSKQVRNLQYAENASLGTFRYRKLTAHRAVTNAGSSQYGIFERGGLDMFNFGDTVQYLKYYNPSNPSVPTVADGDTGTFDRKFLFKTAYCGIVCRNNYQTDCKVKVYLCTPKQSSSINVTTAWQNGVDSNADSSVTTYLQVGQYPSDYSDTKDTWNLKLHCKATLSPGQSMSCSHSVKNIEYDPSAYAQHNASYQSKYKNFRFLIVVEGTVAHDSAVTTQLGLAQAGVDIDATRIYEVQYDAGMNIKFIKVDDERTSTYTNGAVQSHQPIADNIGYSQA